MSEYISIAEFAARAGVTRQSAYKRLDKELQQFVREVDGRKTIDVDALEAYTPQNNSRSNCSATVTETEEVTDNRRATVSETDEIVSATERFTSYLEKENERLRNELAEKDKLIANFASEFSQLVRKEQEITEKALQAASQSQSLQGHLQKQALGERDKEGTVVDTVIDSQGVTVKKGFFSRLLG